jgi:hypothetical protein
MTPAWPESKNIASAAQRFGFLFTDSREIDTIFSSADICASHQQQ